MPVRSSSASGPSGACGVGRSPRNWPGGGANGNINARQTAEWSKPNQWPISCASNDSRSYAPGEDGSAAGVANVACPSLRNSVSESRICPAKAVGALAPTETPGAFAVTTRVNASTPLENPMLDWLKQIVFSPSTLLSVSFEHSLAAVTRPSGAISPGKLVALNVVPVTPDHAPNESVITCSSSESCALDPSAATVTRVGGPSGNEVL